MILKANAVYQVSYDIKRFPILWNFPHAHFSMSSFHILLLRNLLKAGSAKVVDFCGLSHFLFWRQPSETSLSTCCQYFSKSEKPKVSCRLRISRKEKFKGHLILQVCILWLACTLKSLHCLFYDQMFGSEGLRNWKCWKGLWYFRCAYCG